MKRLTSDDVQKALADHTEQNRPQHTDTSKQNDWTRFASRTTVQPLDLKAAREAAWERLKKKIL